MEYQELPGNRLAIRLLDTSVEEFIEFLNSYGYKFRVIPEMNVVVVINPSYEVHNWLITNSNNFSDGV